MIQKDEEEINTKVFEFTNTKTDILLKVNKLNLMDDLLTLQFCSWILNKPRSNTDGLSSLTKKLSNFLTYRLSIRSTVTKTSNHGNIGNKVMYLSKS